MLLVFLVLFISMELVTSQPSESLQIEDGILTSVNQPIRSNILSLSYRYLKGIKLGAFDNVKHITTLILSNNKISYLPRSVFSNLTNLEDLSLAKNDRSLDFLTDQFSSLRNLKTLDLSETSIQPETTVFKGLPDDTSIKLPSLISRVTPNMFSVDLSRQVEKGDLTQYKCSLDFASSIPVHDSIASPGEKKFSAGPSLATLAVICMTAGVVESVEIDNKNCASVGYLYEPLSLRNMSIRGFGKNWYRLPISYNMLTLDENKITEISANVLNDLPQSINIVYLTENKISFLRSNVMNNSNIRQLYLSKNNIQVIENNAFRGLTSLWSLTLSDNKITDLQFIAGLPKSMVVLDLKRNEITQMPSLVFSYLIKLYWLDLSNNKLSKLSEYSFFGLTHLGTLLLENNNLTSIHKGPWDYLPCLQVLSFHSNNITSIKKGFATRMNNLKTLDFYSPMPMTVFERGIFYGLPLESVVNLPRNVKIIEPGLFKNYS